MSYFVMLGGGISLSRMGESYKYVNELDTHVNNSPKHNTNGHKPNVRCTFFSLL